MTADVVEVEIDVAEVISDAVEVEMDVAEVTADVVEVGSEVGVGIEGIVDESVVLGAPVVFVTETTPEKTRAAALPRLLLLRLPLRSLLER